MAGRPSSRPPSDVRYQPGLADHRQRRCRREDLANEATGLPDALRNEVFILLVDYDGQAGADLYAINGEMGGQHDVKAAAKNDVIRMDGPQLADDHGVRHLRRG